MAKRRIRAAKKERFRKVKLTKALPRWDNDGALAPQLGRMGARALTRNYLRRFASDRRGNVAMMFTFAIIPLLLLIGAAIDFGQATRVRASCRTPPTWRAVVAATESRNRTPAAKIAAKPECELAAATPTSDSELRPAVVNAEVNTTVKVRHLLN